MSILDHMTPGPSLSLTDRILGWRDRLLGSHRFQLFAARMPLFRGIARKRSAELFDIAVGFVYTQVLFACVKLKVFDMLAPGPMALSDIARRTGLSDDATERLITAAVAIRLL